jgi:hypothetical protein
MCLRTLTGFISFGILLLSVVVACQEDKSVFDLEVGDCIVPPESTAFRSIEVERVRTVDCSEPHDAEVVAVFEVEGRPWEFPGDEALFREAQQRCPAKCSLYIYPTRQSWNVGDRMITCIVESIYDLRIGDCFNYREREGIIEEVERVSCSKPHTSEVIQVVAMPGTAYPGDDAVDEYAWLNCPGRTDWPLVPTRDSWESVGVREIVCVRER